MTNQEIMQIIADSLDVETDELSAETELRDLDSWDSLAVLALIAALDEKCNKIVNATEIKKYNTVGELFVLFQ